jgi:hypothetical protein
MSASPVRRDFDPRTIYEMVLSATMRFARFIVFPAVVAFIHCGSSSSSSPSADAAWAVNLTGGGGTCALADSSVAFGDSRVDASGVEQRVTDQEVVASQTASVTCSVAPAASGFHVQIQTSIGASALQIDIPSIDASATMGAPATGSVTYESSATVAPYTSQSCNFYFAGASEGVASGKFGAAFTCAQIVNGATSPVSTCALTESYVAVENCALTPIF